MSKKLIITGSVNATAKRKRIQIGAGTDIKEISLPDKKYGLTDDDVGRIVRAGAGKIVEIQKDKPASKQGDSVPVTGSSDAASTGSGAAGQEPGADADAESGSPAAE